MDNNLILRAAYFASKKHKDHRRKDKDSSPYINHPLAVANFLSDIGKINDSEILAAALLHDTIEDTKTKPEELETEFGVEVRRIVEELTDNKKLLKEDRKSKQIEFAKDLSVAATIIKLGDKISNVLDVTNNPPLDWSVERRIQYFDWAEAVVNNCPKVNSELEEYFRKVVKDGRKKLKTLTI